MNLSLFSKCGVFTSASLSICLSAYSDSQRNINRKPNIIFILADDLGYAELGCYGQEKIETPNIDRLAETGMRFTNHYSGQAVSAPSRCVLFTGLHTGHAYIRGNDEVKSRGDIWNYAAMLADSTLEGQRPLPANTVMIPHKLKEAGYSTACIGKWGLGWPGSESTPNKMGFDFFYGYNCQRQAHTYYPPFLYRNEARVYLKNRLLPPKTKLDEGADPYSEESYAKFTQSQYSPDLMYRELLSFVEESKDRPFALFWTTPLPHMPLQAPEKWVRYYVEKWGDEPPYVGNKGYFPCRYPHATYAAMVSYFDEQVGGLVQKLKELRIYENTLIIFTSDNGPASGGAGGADSPYFESARPFSSQSGRVKSSLWEGGIRVPFIVAWPGYVRPGTTSDLLSAFWDIMPTLCDVVGVHSPETDGISFLPEMTGNRKIQRIHEFLYWEYPAAGGQKAIRMDNWKIFVRNIHRGGRKLELYDLNVDPLEQHDVADEHPEIIAKAMRIFRSEHIDSEVDLFAIDSW